jgi:6-pyruvoyltetrahydropterin/6-carboxytetrahydropterin synthase
MVRISQQFEFSASHRLHNHALSAEDNQRLYGKCNNPNGHGHNYVLELAVEMPEGDAAQYSTLTTEQIVKSKIIDRLDHKHLNLEVPPFDRLNPTVENIAVTIWGWLAADFQGRCRMARVRVYETPKTWADYSG